MTGEYFQIHTMNVDAVASLLEDCKRIQMRSGGFGMERLAWRGSKTHLEAEGCGM